MNTTLILITSAFPFQKGEEFLLQETEYYSCFDEVVIIPVAATDFSQKKSISEDIEVHKLSSVASDNPVKKSIGCIFSLRFRETKEEIRYLKKSNRLTLAALKRLLVESNKVNAVSREICNIVREIYTKHADNGIVVYSYWMGNHAKIAVDIKRQFPKIKIVTRCHGGDLYEYRYKYNYIPFRRTILTNEDMIFAISDNGKKYLEENYSGIKAPIVVSRLGTNQKHERIKIDNNDGLNIVSCSYCIPLKRIHLIIQALSEITEKGITWTHIGNGREYENLKNLAEQSIPSNVKFNFLGYVENAKVQELYSSGKFNLFVNVSETEGIPVSIMEAMSYGLPIIATDVGGVSEMVEEERNGYLLPKDFDVANLRHLFIKMLQTDNEDYQAMSERSHEIWKEKFHAKKNYTEFVKILREL